MHTFDRQTDRQTDGQTAFSSLDRVCIPCSAVKIDADVAFLNVLYVPVQWLIKFYVIIFFTFNFGRGGVTALHTNNKLWTVPDDSDGQPA